MTPTDQRGFSCALGALSGSLLVAAGKLTILDAGARNGQFGMVAQRLDELRPHLLAAVKQFDAIEKGLNELLAADTRARSEGSGT